MKHFSTEEAPDDEPGIPISQQVAMFEARWVNVLEKLAGDLESRTNPSFTKEQAFTCFGAHTGSFLRTYQEGTSSYAERAGYPPVPIGPLEFLIEPGRDGIEIRAVQ